MDFADFAKIYGFLRIRSNRADDLFVDGSQSKLTEQIEANDDEAFTLRLFKQNDTIAIRVDNEQRGTILHAHGRRSIREVTVLAQTIDTIAILDMFESENLNGLETMAAYHAKFPRENPLDEYEEERAYAAKAARLIVAGIGEYPALSPEQQALVANEIIAILKDPTPFGFTARVVRALNWCLKGDAQDEWATYVAAWVFKNVNYVDYVDEAPLRMLLHVFPVLKSMSPNR